MNTSKSLLNYLADGKFHSGEEIAQAMGITRSAIWKGMQTIKKMGISCHSVRGKGYVIPGGLCLLNKTIIEQQLATNVKAELNLTVLDTTTSTNDLLRSQLPYQHGQAILAEQQTKGRGRSQKIWHSSYGNAIALSLLWTFQKDPGELCGLSLVTGIAVIKALRKIDNDHDLQLKWPNDILYQQQKVGGILIDLIAETNTQTHAILGIGINVANVSPLQDKIKQSITDLNSIFCYSPDRNQLAAELLNQLSYCLHEFQHKGFIAFKDEWLGLNTFQDQPVTLETPHGKISGICKGVSDQGALLIESQGVVKPYFCGEFI